MAVLIPATHLLFGSRLLRQLLRLKQENVFVSPASVGLAIGMAAAGARGKTLAAIEHTLGVDAKLAADRAKRLFASLDRLPPSVVVELANSLWARSGLALSPGYAAAMREGYRADARSIDFTKPGATTIINDWVARATHGQINSAIDAIDPDTLLALVNATYFYAPWENPFDWDETVDHGFTTASGGMADVRLMQKSGSFRYMEDADVQAIQLPYKGDRFSLVVVLPRQRLSISAFDEIAEPSAVERILTGLNHRPGFLALPKVRLASSADLTAELLEMGMGQAFARDADFSGLFAAGIPASISTVLHKTRLQIDEKGTTAAAATFVGHLGASLVEHTPPTPFEMIVDRPFLLALTERDTDLLLFLGVIGDPTSS